MVFKWADCNTTGHLLTKQNYLLSKIKKSKKECSLYSKAHRNCSSKTLTFLPAKSSHLVKNLLTRECSQNFTFKTKVLLTKFAVVARTPKHQSWLMTKWEITRHLKICLCTNMTIRTRIMRPFCLLCMMLFSLKMILLGKKPIVIWKIHIGKISAFSNLIQGLISAEGVSYRFTVCITSQLTNPSSSSWCAITLWYKKA
jgi:energy-converting hydrogenase Eha subunit C